MRGEGGKVQGKSKSRSSRARTTRDGGGASTRRLPASFPSPLARTATKAEIASQIAKIGLRIMLVHLLKAGQPPAGRGFLAE